MSAQRYRQYTATDHHTWSMFYARQIEKIKTIAYKNFEPGLHRLDFRKESIPDFNALNQRLEQLSGWQIYAVPGLIDNTFFFRKMFSRRFGATTWIGNPEQLDYLEEPDMFHNVFGHVPLLVDPQICDFLHGLAGIAVKNNFEETVIEALARLYWYTIEFGLVKEKDGLRIYGAGILSSIGETDYCLSGKATRLHFDLEKILDTPYLRDNYQEQYFVLESMDRLTETLPALDKKFHSAVGRRSSY